MDAATRSLFLRYDEEGGDFSEEIAVYRSTIQAQLRLLEELGGQEAGAMRTLAGLLA